MQREQTAAMIRMAEFMTAGTDVGDTAVQAKVDAAYQAVAQMWTPNAEAFKNLGQMYVDDPRFTRPTTRSHPVLPSTTATRWPYTPTAGSARATPLGPGAADPGPSEPRLISCPTARRLRRPRNSRTRTSPDLPNGVSERSPYGTRGAQ
jgi:hypothetical protein